MGASSAQLILRARFLKQRHPNNHDGHWAVTKVMLLYKIGGGNRWAMHRGHDDERLLVDAQLVQVCLILSLTWLNLVRRLGQLFGEFADVSGQVGLCMDGMACDFDGKRPVF
ncbi:hypothetical protein ACL1HS_07480, partial [Corynebacterium striatum]|uniref:hypothetical protein n=1 Tax=Corynebacterium striatum TaxID=43770 RepID=UPI001419ECBB